jgi:DNA-directed RNA polymerase subunit K/omega
VTARTVAVPPVLLRTPVHDSPSLGNFHVASLVFQRARQLKNGARPRVDDAAGHVPTRVALMEVRAETVSWTVEDKVEGPRP